MIHFLGNLETRGTIMKNTRLVKFKLNNVLAKLSQFLLFIVFFQILFKCTFSMNIQNETRVNLFKSSSNFILTEDGLGRGATTSAFFPGRMSSSAQNLNIRPKQTDSAEKDKDEETPLETTININLERQGEGEEGGGQIGDSNSDKDKETEGDSEDLISVQVQISDIPQQFIRIRGRRENITDSLGKSVTMARFLGIPFALPPLNNFRFQRPTLFTPRDNFTADEEPEPCPQFLANGDPMGHEDCLKLNIYYAEDQTKNGTEEPLAKLPVLVWFHGESLERLNVHQVFGVLSSGSAADLDPAIFVQNKILVVTPQYRIGTLGFLSTVNEDLNGNMGIFDQLLALEWIHRFISSFGGDSKQITIMGHGGSAMSLGLLSTSELARGLFHRLILMSGSPFSPVAVDSSPKTTFAEIALQNSCPSFPTLRFVRCMQRKTQNNLIDSDYKLTTAGHFGILKTPLPIIQRNPDGRFLPPLVSIQPKTAFETGNFEQVPLIVGVSYAEVAGFLPSLSGRTLKEISGTLLKSERNLKQFIQAVMSRGGGGSNSNLGSGMQAELVTFEYFSGLNVSERQEQAIDLLEEVLSDFLFNIPALSFAAVYSRFAPVYFYVFNYVQTSDSTNLNPNSNPNSNSNEDQPVRQFRAPNQAIHGSDLNFLMSGYKGTSMDRQVSDPMVDFWINFIHKGSPLNSGLDWPQFRVENKNYILFGDQVDTGRNFRARQDFLWTNILPDLSKDCEGGDGIGGPRRRPISNTGNRKSVVTFRDPEDFLKYTSGEIF